jgi:hypothetical protein
MAIDPQLLEQVLRIPESRDVLGSPIVTAVVLQDPANAAALVPRLEDYSSLEARNARRILCQFGTDAVPHIVLALAQAQLEARKAGIEVIWAILTGEPEREVRDVLTGVQPGLGTLLDDRRELPDHMPGYIERDFEGRLCDFTFLLLQQLVDAEYDQSLFRSLDDDGRDEEIGRLKGRGFGGAMV